MNDKENNSLKIEIIKGLFALTGVIITGYITLVAAGVFPSPIQKSKIEKELYLSMTNLQSGLEELDQAIDIVEESEADGFIYCRTTHPANVLHSYEVIHSAKTYDITNEPGYIKKAYTHYQQALQTTQSTDLQTLYNACLVFDRTGNPDPAITQEQFDQVSLETQHQVETALELLQTAFAELP